MAEHRTAHDVPQNVATSTPDSIPETMMSGGGYGVRNGIPYGDQIGDDRRRVDQMMKFFPTKAAAIRAASQKATGPKP